MAKHDTTTMPKLLFVAHGGGDGCDFRADPKLANVVVNTDETTLVGRYRLVEEAEFIATETIRRRGPREQNNEQA